MLRLLLGIVCTLLFFLVVFLMMAFLFVRWPVEDFDEPGDYVPADFDEDGNCPDPECDCRQVAQRLAASFGKHADQALGIQDLRWSAIDEVQARRAMKGSKP